MNLLTAMEKNSLIENSKGGMYYHTSYNANLDLFAGISRFDDPNKIIETFRNAYQENRHLALANLLYILDIREGKGERRIFKIIFKYLADFNPNDAKIILNHIGLLGRYDYLLEGLHTAIEGEVVEIIKTTLASDLNSENPSLLAKWLPSHRTHNANSLTAKYLVKKMGISEKEYRKMLAKIRLKLNIVEKNLSSKHYDNIKFEEVPTKAMLKYSKVFNRQINARFTEYKAALAKGDTKINTTGLFCYEIIKKLLYNDGDNSILDTMWNQQKTIDTGNHNILVVADTSGSMLAYDAIPYASAIGLAIYTAERNHGIFRNKFITFSDTPVLQMVKGQSIVEKYANIKSIVANTDIDKVFKLLLDSMRDSKAKPEDLPTHLVIISDMEFDQGVYSQEGTNFSGWKKAFIKEGYQLPKIIFWNVAGKTHGFPVTKHDHDVVMVSGFSTNLIANIFALENYNPVNEMMAVLDKYLKLI